MDCGYIAKKKNIKSLQIKQLIKKQKLLIIKLKANWLKLWKKNAQKQVQNQKKKFQFQEKEEWKFYR